LDIDYGTYPYVTSSNTTAAGCCQGSGVSITSVKNIVGIFKAYTTRVGNGDFITEINDDVSSVIREKGGEYGSITGRPRRIGWLDLPALKYAVKINGVTELAITKLDILSNLKEILVCKEYNEFANKKPMYEKVESWYEYDFKCKKYNELPDSVKNYIKLIEDYAECPVKYIGTGPNRNELIVRNKGVK
jgi:adenylosuccinate synthase